MYVCDNYITKEKYLCLITANSLHVCCYSREIAADWILNVIHPRHPSHLILIRILVEKQNANCHKCQNRFPVTEPEF